MRPLIRTSLALLLAGSIPALLTAQTADTTLKQETPGLLAQAKVTPDSARAIALHRVPGGTIQSAELEREGGRLVYSFDIKVAGKKGIEEVLVDAMTGRIVSVEHENAAAEAAEQRGEHAPRPATPSPAAPAPAKP